MSHVAKIDLVIHDLQALGEACEALGLRLELDKKTFRRFGGKTQCEHCIILPGNPEAYEIGVVRREEGRGFELALDPWKEGRGILEKVGGKECPKLRQHYAASVTIRKMQAEGYAWKRETSPKGWMRLTFTRSPARARL